LEIEYKCFFLGYLFLNTYTFHKYILKVIIKLFLSFKLEIINNLISRKEKYMKIKDLKIENKKGLSPIISVVLLILVATLLTGAILSWAKNSAREKLDSTQKINTLNDLDCRDSRLKVIDCTIDAVSKDINLVVENKSKISLSSPTLSIAGLDFEGNSVKLFGVFNSVIESGQVIWMSTKDTNSFSYTQYTSQIEDLDLNNLQQFNLSTLSCPSNFVDIKNCIVFFPS